MTVSDLPVEGRRPWPGISDHQFDSADLTEAHRHWRCRGRGLDQELKATIGLERQAQQRPSNGDFPARREGGRPQTQPDTVRVRPG